MTLSPPKSLEIDGVDYSIRSDFRVALLIFEAYQDNELDDLEKSSVCLECLYEDVPPNIEKAFEKAIWFLDGGDTPKSKQQSKKLMDWKQDESIIFPAINKTAGYETRNAEFVHWWTFLGFFNEIDNEGLYSQVMSIRFKKSKGKKLEKWEQEFYRNNKELVDIKQTYSAEEQAEIDRLKKLLGD